MVKKIYEKPIINKINAGVPDKSGMATHIKEIPEIEGIPVEEITKEYGSPVFVVSEKIIRETYQDAYRAFSTRYPKVQFAWSYKTNYLDAVCNVYKDLGSWAEVVSMFEYEKAQRNGIKTQNIIFNGPYKSKETLKTAVENGSYIHIDNFDELYNLAEVLQTVDKKAKVAIRINMETGIYPQWDRFGFNYENGEAWTAITLIMKQEKMQLVGLHTHIGTYILLPSAYGVAASKMSNLMLRIKAKYNHVISYIDLGGGFASKNTLKGAYLPGKDTCPTFDQYAEAITNAINNSGIEINDLPTLFLETGRALIDDAGYLIGKVKANKQLANGRKSLVLDVGINNLFTSFWYNHDVYPAHVKSHSLEDITLYGPLCMNIDCLRAAIHFPPMDIDDHIVIVRVGAYNLSQWMQFISYRPNVVMIDTKGKMHLIRRAENLETFTSQEVSIK
ncbi:MAG: alanine racemase [Prolixibacteraceae bacterium]|nr:alanine racemase [Prolixibacteraceae bacterium]